MKPAPPVMRSFIGYKWERDAGEEGDKGPLSPTALEGDEWAFVAYGLWGGWGGGVVGGGGDDRLESYPTFGALLTRRCFGVATWGVGDKEAFVAYGLGGRRNCLRRLRGSGKDGAVVGTTGWKPIPQESGPNSWRIRLRVGLANAAGWEGRWCALLTRRVMTKAGRRLECLLTLRVMTKAGRRLDYLLTRRVMKS